MVKDDPTPEEAGELGDQCLAISCAHRDNQNSVVVGDAVVGPDILKIVWLWVIKYLF